MYAIAACCNRLTAAFIIVPALAIVALAAPFRAGAQDGPQEVDGQPAYRVVIKGAPSEEVERILRSVSEAVELKGRPPPSIRMLGRRAEIDLKEFRKALDSLGYFEATLDFRVIEKTRPLKLVYEIEPGRRFRLASAEVRVKGGDALQDAPSAEQVGLKEGELYSARKIVDARKRILSTLSRRGRPFPEIVESRIVADYRADVVRVEFIVDPGPEAEFGGTEIRGLETVDEAYARSMIPWKPGDEYDASLLDDARMAFFNTGLFSRVEISRADMPSGGRLPINVTLAERKHRTVKAGVEYNTDYGPGVRFGWEHRNYLGSGEKLAAELSLNELKRSLEASLRKPTFLSREQELVVKTSMADERTEAFTSRSLDVSAVLERDVAGVFKAGYGAGYRFSDTEDKHLEETDSFGHVYFPLTVVRDRRDQVLDPSAGYDVGGAFTPHVDTLGSGANFIKYRLKGTKYWSLTGRGRTILAVRAMYGAIAGADREEVPADLRFHAGGGGTIRGYPYQTAGPLNDDDEPIGGKSMLVGGAELRFKLTDAFGISPFLDGGRAYENGHPDFDEDLFWGAGMGFQYYTGFGPVRVDVAVPLDRREDVDDPFQIYVNLGHTF
jgi:translocation and assembly module TamA